MTLLQQSPATGDRASGADPATSTSSWPSVSAQISFSGGTGVDGGLAVGELLQQIGIGDFIHQFLRQVNRPLNPFHTGVSCSSAP